MNAARFLALITGALFGAGLNIGGMTNPARVRGFLDIFGDWDPTLIFVMGGALIVMTLAWQIQARMGKPVMAPQFSVPNRSDVTSNLVRGSVLFGVGWGIAGLCPGPAIAAIVIEPVSAAIFVVAMLVGMLLAEWWQNRGSTPEGASPAGAA